MSLALKNSRDVCAQFYFRHYHRIKTNNEDELTYACAQMITSLPPGQLPGCKYMIKLVTNDNKSRLICSGFFMQMWFREFARIVLVHNLSASSGYF